MTRRPLSPSEAIPEKEWQDTLVKALRTMGWSTNHTRRAIGKNRQWTTPTSAVGWPDLVSLKGGFLLAIECKSAVGKVTPEQLQWLARFALLPCARSWVLRPTDDWQQITNWLREPASSPIIFGWAGEGTAPGDD